jgi:hypothetical protein
MKKIHEEGETQGKISSSGKIVPQNTGPSRLGKRFTVCGQCLVSGFLVKIPFLFQISLKKTAKAPRAPSKS